MQKLEVADEKVRTPVDKSVALLARAGLGTHQSHLSKSSYLLLLRLVAVEIFPGNGSISESEKDHAFHDHRDRHHWGVFILTRKVRVCQQ